MVDIKNCTESLKSVKKPLKLSDFKPSDCKHCYIASLGVVGAHYSCNCKESKMYGDYPLMMCPQDCEHYEDENKPEKGLFGEE